jgi:hypothetical protein
MRESDVQIGELKMKTAAKIAGAVIVFLVLVLVILRITGLNPIGDTPGRGNYPGLWLSGKVVSAPVADWSFATQYKTDKLQTRTWYIIPHSVTTGFVVHDGQLYVTSMFGAGVPFPQGKSWVANAMRDPHVRIKLGGNLYDCVLSPVTDSDERAAVLGPRARQSAPNGPTMHLFHAVSDRNLAMR